MITKGVNGVFYSPPFLCQLSVQKWYFYNTKNEPDSRLETFWT